jgi:hypothetical protein
VTEPRRYDGTKIHEASCAKEFFVVLRVFASSWFRAATGAAGAGRTEMRHPRRIERVVRRSQRGSHKPNVVASRSPVGAWTCFGGACTERPGAAAHDWVAPVTRRVAREEKHDAGARKIDARSKKVGASTEIRIASQKTFAATFEKDDASASKDDAPARRIGSTVDKMVASSDVALGADEKVGASADEIDATNKKVDATIEKVDASAKNQESTSEEVQ